MKKFIICLLFVLSTFVSAMAQTTQQHLFPEVVFRYGTSENPYYMPAWDALTTKKERVQKVIENNGGSDTGGDDGGGDDGGGDDGGGDDGGGDDGGGDDTGGDTGGDEGGDTGGSSTTEPDPESPGWDTGGGGAPGDDDVIIEGNNAKASIRRAPRRVMNGIIVASSCAIEKERDIETVSPRGTFTELIYIKRGDVYDEVGVDPATVTYGDIFGDAIDATLGQQPLIQLPANGFKITGSHTIPETATAFSQDEDASQYNIVGLGDAAYYNGTYTPNSSTAFFRATSLTIPKYIKYLGKRCFQAAGTTTKITIAEDSEIEELPFGCFAHSQRLREINIPASIHNINAHALGGTKNLGKIVFNSNVAPDNVSTNAFEKISGSSTDVNPNNCAVWVKDMQTIKDFRNHDAIWNDFAFCIPFEMKKNVISYCSDLILSPYPLNLKTDDEANAWNTIGDDDSFTGIIKMHYVDQTKIDPVSSGGQNTIKVVRMKSRPVKPGFGVLISGDVGIQELYIRNVGKSVLETNDNLLVGTLDPTDMTNIINDNNNYVYVLKDGQFVRCTGGTLAANKAYLKLPKDLFGGRTEAKVLDIVFDNDDDTDGMKGIETANAETDNNWYTLQGIRVESPSRGVFIRGGKKYIFN